MVIWQPGIHGTDVKKSAQAVQIVIYRRDAEFGKDSSMVTRTSSFDMPIKRNRKGEYKLQPDDESVYACMTSDFFLDEADKWRAKAWDIIRRRSDVHIVIITKRIKRFEVELPEDWGSGYENVTLCCTCENQNQADYRLPVFLKLPIKHRTVIHEPMLEQIDIKKYLAMGKIEGVTCKGESGPDARICDSAWILDSMEQCVEYDIPFWFKQTGARFKKGNKAYLIDRKDQMSRRRRPG